MTDMKAIFIAMSLLVAANDLGSGVTITGQLVDAGTRQPLRGAIVSATRVPTDKPGVSPNIGFRTGSDGKFVLRGVAPGVVKFYVAKAGYAPGPYTSARPAADGERIDNVVLTVLPGASISGRVADESGRGVAGVSVRVTSGTQVDQTGEGPREMSRFHTSLLNSSQGDTVVTDDEGRYWAGGLLAGIYEVAVSKRAESMIVLNGQQMVIGRVVESEPASVTVTSGEERTLDLIGRVLPSGSFTGKFTKEKGTGSIVGRVVDAGGRGVPYATVALGSSGGAEGQITVTTDSGGSFRIPALSDGSYQLRALRGDYKVLWMDPARTVTATVAGGARTENAVLILMTGGAISGTVTDEFGDPVAADVIVVGTSRAEGFQNGRVIPADAHGRYRITGLPPGKYLLATQSAVAGEVHFDDEIGQERILAIQQVFYPGVPKASLGSLLDVAEGAEAAGVDFVLRPISVATINVTLTTPVPVDDIQLRHISLDDRIAVVNMTPVNGSAITLDVRPGRYRLVASADVPAGNDTIRLWSAVEVEADSLLPASADMTLEPGANVSGSVIFEESNVAVRQGPTPPPAPSLLPMAQPPGAKLRLSPGNSRFDAKTGSFSIEGVLPGRYVIQTGAVERGAPWMLKAATLNGRDILDQPIDLDPRAEIDAVVLTVTDRLGELTISFTDVTAKPASDQWVIVFSADARHWYAGSRRTRLVPPDDRGNYVVRGLPAGAYVVSRIPNSVSQTDDLSQILPTLVPSGVRFTVLDGEKRVVSVGK